MLTLSKILTLVLIVYGYYLGFTADEFAGFTLALLSTLSFCCLVTASRCRKVTGYNRNHWTNR